MRAVRTTVKCNPACTGCTYETQEIPRAVGQTRQIWVELSPACDAEFKAERESARQSHVERTRIKALEEEFT